MMKKLNFAVLFTFAFLSIVSCKDDDDNRIVVRDRTEVYTEDLTKLQQFLDTHFYNYEDFAAIAPGADFTIVFDTIANANAGKIPLSSQVISRVLNRDGIDYTYYVLNVRQGGGALQPTFADSTLVSYEGRLLDNTLFDGANNSVWFDLPGTIDGFVAGVTELNEATSITSNGDGTRAYENSGVGAVFFPSGLGYFNVTRPGIPAYAPLIFTYQLRKVKITDHDGDGIFSKFEDLDGDKSVRSPGNRDNTNGKRDQRGFIYNYIDADDDGDGIPTKDENADPNGDGNPDDALDSNGNGIPDYLDPSS